MKYLYHFLDPDNETSVASASKGNRDRTVYTDTWALFVLKKKSDFVKLGFKVHRNIAAVCW
jgi:hypothetical protein